VTPFEQVLNWLREERGYQRQKFDYETEGDKTTEYWIQQFDSYIQRLPVFDTPETPDLYAQAALKLAATAVALCEHLAERQALPYPGVPSGEIR
jgi:hypothetical protein